MYYLSAFIFWTSPWQRYDVLLRVPTADFSHPQITMLTNLFGEPAESALQPARATWMSSEHAYFGTEHQYDSVFARVPLDNFQTSAIQHFRRHLINPVAVGGQGGFFTGYASFCTPPRPPYAWQGGSAAPRVLTRVSLVGDPSDMVLTRDLSDTYENIMGSGSTDGAWGYYVANYGSKVFRIQIP